MSKPVIGITMGDPSGIGPEIVLKSFSSQSIYELTNPLVIGNPEVFDKINRETLKLPIKLKEIDNPRTATYSYHIVNIFPISNLNINNLCYGQVQAASGKAAFECIEKSVALALTGEIDAITTAPINKEAIKAAKLNFIGHTEMFAELTNSIDPLTMYQVNNLRVFFLSRHVSLRKACELVKKETIIDYVIRCRRALKNLGIVSPLIAVAGLNPHNGEGGMFGDEEITEIEPAVSELKAKGVKVVGPIPADSVFALALAGKFDGVLSLYHDQGHIATKTVDFEKTISLTIGLPFLRSSVDHGTAFDIAGKGVASAISMEEAIKVAAKYSTGYKPGN